MSAVYRTRPDTVQALQWLGDNTEAMAAFAGRDFRSLDPEAPDHPYTDFDCTAALRLTRDDAWVLLRHGDWVIRDRDGHLWRYRDADFTDVYEPVDAQ